MGHERTTNRFDLFRFQSGRLRSSADRERVLPILGDLRRGCEIFSEWGRSNVEGRGLHRALRRLLSYRANAI
jgi:hypothetical protein